MGMKRWRNDNWQGKHEVLCPGVTLFTTDSEIEPKPPQCQIHLSHYSKPLPGSTTVLKPAAPMAGYVLPYE